ncbi:MAG: hypothetical protein WKF35_12350 [Ferruginibacter sp.]
MAIKNVKKFFFVSLITYLLVELICFLFIKVKFKTAHFPEFTFEYNYSGYPFPFAEINPVWGTWHYPEDYTEKRSCFESTYHINLFGARDKERSKVGDTNRILFLGDSFIEGFGLKAEERVTNQLEQLTGREVLNFGCGYFTPTQSFLVYEKLAKQFSHNTVVLGVLPFNDLAEDDTSFHEKDKFIHYQPYFQGISPDYQLIYRQDDLSKSTFNKEGFKALQNTRKERISRFLKSFTFWYNIYGYIKNKKSVTTNGKPYSGYYDFTKPQVDKLKFIIKKLQVSALGKQLIVISLPVLNDFLRLKEKRVAPLVSELALYCNTNNIIYVDLLTQLNKKSADPSTLYLSCDGHWNAEANRMATEILLPLLRK